MKIAKNIFIVFFITISLFFVWVQHKPKKVEFVYLYDNFLWGLGDKMAQERFVKEFDKFDIKSKTLSEYTSCNFQKFLARLTDSKRYFTILQSLLTDSRHNILTPLPWNKDVTFISLLYNAFDHTSMSSNEKELCKKYWRLNLNHKNGRRISGILATTGNYININCKQYDQPYDFLLTWYPTIPEYKFIDEEPKIEKIFYPLGGGWDLKRISSKFLGFLNNSGKKGYLEVYGPNTVGNFGESTKEVFGNTYIRYLKDTKEILDTSRKYSAVLVLHSDTHFDFAIPSGRIFEAMASGRLIISDMNPWVLKHLSNSVLYIDTSKSQKDIENQIENHITWIRENPEKAKSMAARSHKIFLEKYKLEYQVKDLVDILHKLDYSKTNLQKPSISDKEETSLEEIEE